MKAWPLVAGIVLLLLTATGIALAAGVHSRSIETWKRHTMNQCAGEQNRTRLREAAQAKIQEEAQIGLTRVEELEGTGNSLRDCEELRDRERKREQEQTCEGCLAGEGAMERQRLTERECVTEREQVRDREGSPSPCECQKCESEKCEQGNGETRRECERNRETVQKGANSESEGQ